VRKNAIAKQPKSALSLPKNVDKILLAPDLYVAKSERLKNIDPKSSRGEGGSPEIEGQKSCDGTVTERGGPKRSQRFLEWPLRQASCDNCGSNVLRGTKEVSIHFSKVWP
jgi:hypothetical protein